MLSQIGSIALDWQKEVGFDRCGIGFGGPVDFARQRVALSTHVGGWQDFPLAPRVKELFGVPVVIDNDANTAGSGEARYGGHGALPLFYMTLSTGIGGRDRSRGRHGLPRGRFLGGGDWAFDNPAGRPRMFVRRAWLPGTNVLRAYGSSGTTVSRPRSCSRTPSFVERYVVDLALGIEGGDHAAESRANRDRGRNRESGRGVVCASARGAAASAS